MIALGIAGMLAGCSTIQSVDLPVESAMDPAQTAFWEEISGDSGKDWFYLLNVGPEALEWRLRMIDTAVSSIDLQTFLWMWDQAGSQVLRHLLDAADRGVRVRLLLDDTFLNAHPDIVWNLSHHENVEFRVYNPFGRRLENLAFRQLLNLGEFSRLDHRMHNKSLIVDNRAAIIGGRNLADEYFGLHGEANFRDMEVLLAGASVVETSKLFDEFWNNQWSIPLDIIYKDRPGGMDAAAFREWISQQAPRALDESPQSRQQKWRAIAAASVEGMARLIADHPARENPADHDQLPDQLAVELQGWLDRAESELILVSAYFIPTPELESTIERAEARGVRVRILTNSIQSNNHLAAHSAYRHHLHRLIGHGAELHEVRPFAKDRNVYIADPVEDKELGLHAKLILIDDNLTFIGSANLDPRSLRLNTEMGVLIDSGPFNATVRDALDLDFYLRNAWQLELRPNGQPVWRSDEGELFAQPASGALQRLEDWFLGILPIESEM